MCVFPKETYILSRISNFNPDQWQRDMFDAIDARVNKNFFMDSRSCQKKPGAGAAWKKSQEPEPLKKLPASKPCEKLRKLYFSYSSLGKILSLWLQIQLFYLFYIFLQFYLISLLRKEYFAKEPESGVFGPLEPEPLEKKYLIFKDESLQK